MTPTEIMDGAIHPALRQIGYWSDAAGQLVLGTFIHESKLKDRRQIASYGPPVRYGPALGLGQMEPVTHDDCWESFLAYRKLLAAEVRGLTTIRAPEQIPATELINNDPYAAAMCRVKYMRASEPLPYAGDLEGMAAYWKKHYNSEQGAGTPEEYLADWHAFMD